LFVYLEKERLVSGAGKREGWHRRRMKRKEVSQELKEKVVPEHVVCE
jgi:hypothetical protein